MTEESLRQKIGREILQAFEQAYWQSRYKSDNPEEHLNYDPDVCWQAADRVVAALVTSLSGQRCRVKKSGGMELDSARLF
jgi:hypothetical protein